MDYVTLYSVKDIRTNLIHSVAIVKARNARFYVPVEDEQSDD